MSFVVNNSRIFGEFCHFWWRQMLLLRVQAMYPARLAGNLAMARKLLMFDVVPVSLEEGLEI
jgi:hypothetical protein